MQATWEEFEISSNLIMLGSRIKVFQELLGCRKAFDKKKLKPRSVMQRNSSESTQKSQNFKYFYFIWHLLIPSVNKFNFRTWKNSSNTNRHTFWRNYLPQISHKYKYSYHESWSVSPYCLFSFVWLKIPFWFY